MEIPESYQAQAKEWHEKLVEKAAEQDDDLMNKFFDAGTLTEAEIKQGIRKGVISDALYPLMCGSALMNKGVQLVLDAVVDFLPSPLDINE